MSPKRKSKTSLFFQTCQAFTLVELMVVIFIIAILASILLPALCAVFQSSRGKACLAEIQQMKSALSLYEEVYRDYPPSTLGELGLRQNNNINGGIESMVATLSGSYKETSYFEFRENQLENSDADKSPISLNRLTQSVFNTNELFELVDPWANPYIYFHSRDILDTTRHTYILQGQKRYIGPSMSRTKTGRIKGIGQCQIFSCGADNEANTADDIMSE